MNKTSTTRVFTFQLLNTLYKQYIVNSITEHCQEGLFTNFTNHFRAILIGVVRQEVKRSAGSSGFMGSNSDTPHAASWIQFLTEDTAGVGLPNLGVDPFSPD